MRIARARPLACALCALAVIALAAPASSAVAAKGKHRAYKFGTRPLGPGARGKDVRFLQRALTRLGIATGIDGAYGKGTMRSVKALERQRGWGVNGVVSRKEAKRIKKLVARLRVSGSYFVQGYTAPVLKVTARHAGHTKAKVLDASGNLVQVVPLSFAGPDSREVSWNGMTPTGVAADGTYQLKLGKTNTAGATASGQTQPFGMRLHAFPVPGPHTFGGPDARFGAPRSGHTHQGQDVPAACGQKLLVSETGQVSVNAYQATGAGYYVVLHGALTGTDFVYMHLQRPSWAAAGTNVYAGQQIGRVGDTGDAQGCHLHFERWSAPGWYVGGAPYDPLPELTYWDTYS
jgi:peptidoglycan hydrolase-like protein with peptidoglycan-binding domain